MHARIKIIAGDMLEKTIELANPVSEEYNCLRNSITPKLLEFFSSNKHYELPQKIFETGDVVLLTNKGEFKTRTYKYLAGGITSLNTGFTEIKSNCEALLRNLDINAEFKETKTDYFIEGRAAEIHYKNKKIGLIGEIHPKILENFSIENPVAVFEVNLEKLG